MTAIDKAFIRAYTQQDSAAAAELDDVPGLSFAEQLVSQPAELLAHPPHEVVEPAAAPAPQDNSAFSLDDLSAALGGLDERPSQQRLQAVKSPPAESPPTDFQEPDFQEPESQETESQEPESQEPESPCLLYRVDPPASKPVMADPVAAADHNTVPPPHIAQLADGPDVATEPLENATEPLENATEPLENATEPLENATEPLEN
ncbi:MAG: hypothetical protein HQ567_34900, partial [Candidatus Nealsonbacteria bacterium]|nr:hypothetical protein [Candidatus Nealsonbacteria bacterium]